MARTHVRLRDELEAPSHAGQLEHAADLPFDRNKPKPSGRHLPIRPDEQLDASRIDERHAAQVEQDVLRVGRHRAIEFVGKDVLGAQVQFTFGSHQIDVAVAVTPSIEHRLDRGFSFVVHERASFRLGHLVQHSAIAVAVIALAVIALAVMGIAAVGLAVMATAAMALAMVLEWPITMATRSTETWTKHCGTWRARWMPTLAVWPRSSEGSLRSGVSAQPGGPTGR